MNAKNITVAGIAGGILLLVAMVVFGKIANAISPYDMASLPGMRTMQDPLMLLFFLYPFVLAFIAAILFDMIRGSLHGTMWHKAITFGGLLFLLETIPSAFVIFSTMTYPPGFFISSFLNGVIAFPLLGLLFVNVWKE